MDSGIEVLLYALIIQNCLIGFMLGKILHEIREKNES